MDVADEALIKQAMQAVSRIRPQRDAKRAAIMPESAVKFLFDCPESQFEGKPEKGLVRSAFLSGISLSLRSGELLRIRSQDITEILPGVPGTRIRIHLGITKVNKIEYVETSCDASKDV
ncbi:hypothetical protein Pmar_PMAR003039 [Perkinsus marinus ATCC 50983]|uniref:Uncharacterized protein n=1 Tax=Perkinsus marinus (strain ATCC 50983 / TXsc) TaxID=423536 RepID=C5LE41_PERM5|nr:hypothetical protein Pmar_PMAR003039 [Perkinsus marinus ATCC 50983]EER05002.1 hypothetical protein Pmar_PMAR003039 [Perkinsus marinus ATCC 50983]|eukprot:XP_002773186.1 hypothetical protein Pmar_PMAR003039 [Perkinsus marinus ATCC 50983]